MTLLVVAWLLAGADYDDEEVDASEGPLCSLALHADIGSVDENELSYITLSAALRNLSSDLDRYRSIFSTTIIMKYECQRCYRKRFDEPESEAVLGHPLDQYFAPSPLRIFPKARADSICGGPIICHRQFPGALPTFFGS